jgi:spore coat polysaccharide biosynthesis predicted glycosyltransferase SpsG
MSKTKFALLVEGDYQIGMGHLYRCLHLKKQLELSGLNVFFIIPTNTVCLSFCIENDIPHIALDVPDYKAPKAICRIMKKELSQMNGILIDLIEERYKQFVFLRKFKNLLIFSITLFEFNKGNRYEHISFYPFPKKLDYNIVYSIFGQTKIFSGPEYIGFSEDLMLYKNKIKPKNVIPKILVTLGGSDPCDFTTKVIKVLEQVKTGFILDVVCGKANKKKDEINLLLKNGKLNYMYHEAIDYLPKLMHEADFAIINGGLIRYELTLLGTPYIAISIHKTQYSITELLSSQTGDINLGIGDELESKDIINAVYDLLSDVHKRNNISTEQSKFFSENGYKLIVKKLIAELNNEENK